MMRKLQKLNVVESLEEFNSNNDDIDILERVDLDKVLVSYNKHHYIVDYYSLLRGSYPSIQTAVNKTNVFIHRAIEMHGDKYDYSKVEYIKSNHKVAIICPIHGSFMMKPSKHLSNQGCKRCHYETKAGVWSHSEWDKAGKRSDNFDGFKVYIIECWNDTEHFYKIGKTFKKVKHRFPNKRIMPYKWKVVNIIEGDSKYISKLELKLHRLNKDNKYTPKIEFGGMYECFTSIEGGL